MFDLQEDNLTTADLKILKHFRKNHCTVAEIPPHLTKNNVFRFNNLVKHGYLEPESYSERLSPLTGAKTFVPSKKYKLSDKGSTYLENCFLLNVDFIKRETLTVITSALTSSVLYAAYHIIKWILQSFL